MFVIPPRFRDSRTPGQVPSREGMAALRLAEQKPPGAKFTAQRLLEHGAEPRLTPESVVKGLGLDAATESGWVKFLGSTVNNATNELVVRKALFEHFREHPTDPVLRNVIFARALSFYRSRMGKSIEGVIVTKSGTEPVEIVSLDKALKLTTETLDTDKVKADAAARRRRTLQRRADRERERALKQEQTQKSMSRAEIVQFYLNREPRADDRPIDKRMHKLLARRPDLAAKYATMDDFPELEKGEAKGGKYHKRVTDPSTGKHRYYYDPKKYEAEHKHIDGASAAKEFLSKQIERKFETLGECEIEHFKDLAEKHGPDKVADALREGCGSGRYEFKGGKFRKCQGGASV